MTDDLQPEIPESGDDHQSSAPQQEPDSSSAPTAKERDSRWNTSMETRIQTTPGVRPKKATLLNSADDVQKVVRQVLPRLGSARLEHERPLARGGMGHVDIVLDVGLQRRMARKVIGSGLSSKGRNVCLFLREAQITAQLDHPSIVPVHEVGSDEVGRLFFTMKLVEGKTLDEWQDAHAPEEAPLSSELLLELLEIVIKLCDAVAFAHDRGVVHGDIKPPNVMVGDYGQVYLMDWGLARLKPDSTTQISEVLSDEHSSGGGGTPAFMSPEQARGEAIDERTDVFGLGSLLYCALRGRPPYWGKTLADTLLKASLAEFDPLLQADYANVPGELLRIVSKSMAASSSERHESVAELGSELRAVLRGGEELPRIRVASGDTIIRQGETGNEVFVLESGRASVTREIDGDIVHRGELGPGDVFGEMAILVEAPRNATVTALEDCVLTTITGDLLQREVHGMKPWMGALIRTLAQRFQRQESDEA